MDVECKVVIMVTMSTHWGFRKSMLWLSVMRDDDISGKGSTLLPPFQTSCSTAMFEGTLDSG
jgi:hypothetical protein